MGEEEGKRIREYFQEKFEEATKSDVPFNAIRRGIMSYVVDKTIGSVAGTTNNKTEEAYQTLLGKLDKEGKKVFKQFISETNILKYRMLIEIVEKFVDFTMENLVVIAEEMNMAVKKMRKESN